MTKKQNTQYDEPLPFDLYHKKRQEEIRKELSAWSQTTEFRSCVKDEVEQVLKNQDELANLSRRLFENGTFLALFSGLTLQEHDATKKNRWWNRYNKIIVFISGAFTLAIFDIIKDFICKLIAYTSFSA